MKAVFKNINIAICLFILITMAVVSLTGFADETASLTVSVTPQRVQRGDTIDVKVTLSGLTSMAGMDFDLNFDKDSLEYVENSLVPNDFFLAKGFVNEMSELSLGTIMVSIVTMNTEISNYDVQAPIDIMTLQFKVKDNADYKTNSIRLTKNKIVYIDETLRAEEIPSRVVNGSYTVYDPSASPSPTPITGGGGGGGATLQPVGSSTPEPTPTVTPGQTDKPKIVFSDVFGWAEEYVYYLAEKGIVVGRSEGIFAPNDNVTRAEFVTMLARSVGEAGMPVGEDGGTFTDINSAGWYAPYVEWAASKNIVLGYEDGTFAPNKNITREELCTMIVRALTVYGEAPEEAELNFADAGSISDWAKSSIASLARMGVVSGKGENQFYPKDLATRAETAKIIAGAFRDIIEQR